MMAVIAMNASCFDLQAGERHTYEKISVEDESVSVNCYEVSIIMVAQGVRHKVESVADAFRY